MIARYLAVRWPDGSLQGFVGYGRHDQSAIFDAIYQIDRVAASFSVRPCQCETGKCACAYYAFEVDWRELTPADRAILADHWASGKRS